MIFAAVEPDATLVQGSMSNCLVRTMAAPSSAAHSIKRATYVRYGSQAELAASDLTSAIASGADDQGANYDVRFGRRVQQIAATHSANFSAGV